MSWLQLKLQMLPSISNEIDTAIKQFHRLISKIDECTEKGETDVFMLSEYSRLRAQMRARMEEITVFYNENLDDEKIHFFEKLRMRIKKALMNRPGKKFMLQEMETGEFRQNQDLFNTAPQFFEKV